jgi:predicted nucleic acid-binding Zn ribbon protein
LFAARQEHSSDLDMHEQLIPEETVIRCHACGRENPASHRFCGVCGATLEADGDSQSEGSEEDLEAGSSNRERQDREQKRREYQPEAFETSISNPDELSLFRSFRPKATSSEDDWGNEPSHRRRIYIGMVLAVIIGGLGYMAWRKAQSSSQNSPAPAPPSVASNQPAAAAAPTRPTESGSEATKPAVTNHSAKAQPEKPKSAEPSTALPGTRNEKPKAAQVPPAPEQSAAPAAVDNGSEELAVAQRYLGDSSGRGRDSAEAAKWLWKSIAKHNSQATILLADLYLKGDGVSKNCDQARVLLDSAARKGIAAAGERLRNLQAFGCQ